MPPTADRPIRRKPTLLIAIGVWAALVLVAGLLFRAQGDYHSYLNQWKLALDGKDPWSTNNAYGPLHTALAVLVPLGPLVPKFFMQACMLAGAAIVFFRAAERTGKAYLVPILLAIPLNFTFFVQGVEVGMNDDLAAALMVGAVISRLDRRFALAGLFVGLAALLKYYPILMLPFFALDNRRIDWRLILIGGATFAIGMVAAYLYWGDGLIKALIFGSSRGPKQLSILAALKSSFPKSGLVAFLIAKDTYLVLAGVAGLFALTWWLRVQWLVATVLGYLLMLTLYKVGHVQFFIPWLFLVAALACSDDKQAAKLIWVFVPALLLLSAFSFFGEFMSDHYRQRLSWVRDYGGYLAFPTSVLTIAVCFWLDTTGRAKLPQSTKNAPATVFV